MKRVFYGQVGYVGMSRSVNADRAEADGKRPLSRAILRVASGCHITQKSARGLCVSAGPCEYHHTGKYARYTGYYDCDNIIKEYHARTLPVPAEVSDMGTPTEANRHISPNEVGENTHGHPLGHAVVAAPGVGDCAA